MKFVVRLVLLLLLIFCTSNYEGDINIMDENLEKDLVTISKAKIYFGHQSVGKNILSGLEALVEEAKNVELNIIDVKNNTDLPQYYLAHSSIGQNTNPLSKCEDFTGIMEEPFLDSLDAALLKFCYIDFDGESNISDIFDCYNTTIEQVKKMRPATKIIYTTVPLETQPMLLKKYLKIILGKGDPVSAANIKRNEFNELIKSTYSQEPIFDLAKVESTYPNNTRESFNIEGKNYYSLVGDYTHDGGHLNDLGGKIVAKEFVHILAKSIRERE
jgi:hypothetical protein